MSLVHIIAPFVTTKRKGGGWWLHCNAIRKTQSYFIQVARSAIFMQPNLIFGQILGGSAENICNFSKVSYKGEKTINFLDQNRLIHIELLVALIEVSHRMTRSRAKPEI